MPSVRETLMPLRELAAAFFFLLYSILMLWGMPWVLWLTAP